MSEALASSPGTALPAAHRSRARPARARCSGSCRRTARAAAAYGLKEIIVVPTNPARGLDTHMGGVLLHDEDTGELVAIMNASPITEIRTAAVSAVATRRSPGRTRSGSRSSAPARRRGSRPRAAGECSAIRDPDLGAQPGSGRAACRRGGRDRVPVRRRGAVRSRGRLYDHGGHGADRREALAGRGAHVNAVGSCFPTTRELDTETVAHASFFTDRRRSCLSEAGDYMLAAAEGAVGPEHIRAELGEVLAGMHPGREHEDGSRCSSRSGSPSRTSHRRSSSCARRGSEVGAEVEF